MKCNLLKAELIFRRLHLKKKDEGTLLWLKCMIHQKKLFEDLYDIYNERTDSLNGLILYKIGQGHILNQYGNSSNLEIGLFS
jgi:hypothetical protein